MSAKHPGRPPGAKNKKPPKPTGKPRGKGRPFPPGNNANPSGRPKGSRGIRNMIEEVLLEKPGTRVTPATKGEQLVRRNVGQALKGNLRATSMIYDRLEGTPVQTVHQTGQGILPLRVVFQPMTREEFEDADNVERVVDAPSEEKPGA